MFYSCVIFIIVTKKTVTQTHTHTHTHTKITTHTHKPDLSQNGFSDAHGCPRQSAEVQLQVDTRWSVHLLLGLREQTSLLLLYRPTLHVPLQYHTKLSTPTSLAGSKLGLGL